MRALARLPPPGSAAVEGPSTSDVVVPHTEDSQSESSTQVVPQKKKLIPKQQAAMSAKYQAAQARRAPENLKPGSRKAYGPAALQQIWKSEKL